MVNVEDCEPEIEHEFSYTEPFTVIVPVSVAIGTSAEKALRLVKENDAIKKAVFFIIFYGL